MPGALLDAALGLRDLTYGRALAAMLWAVSFGLLLTLALWSA